MPKKISLRSLLFIVLLPFLVACHASIQTTWTNSGPGNYYIFSRESILQSIVVGEEDIFIPISEKEGLTGDRFVPGSIPWHQADYMEIAQALSKEEAWDESFNQWGIGKLIFDVSCKNADVGFSGGFLEIYKPGTLENRHYRLSRILLIHPLENSISVYEEERGTHWEIYKLPKVSIVDINKLNITAEEALNMAEEAGGRAFREGSINNCSVSVWYSHENDGWVTTYSFSPTYLRILVNAYSGELEILEKPETQNPYYTSQAPN